MSQLTIVVDAANVVGAAGRGDGWWRDRAGAARRLRDALARLAPAGIRGAELPTGTSGGALDRVYPRIVLVVEGAAAPVAADTPGPAGAAGPVTVLAAPGSGDDQIVATTAAAQRGQPAGSALVVTADRELRRRVTAIGATVAGPRWLVSLLADMD